jgi:site-specific DNA recombinase
MLTLAYCRVSTEEQAEEGFSVEGQADKLRSYSNLRDLGEVTIITDPGLSGKNLQRPGLQQLLAAVEAGHVSHVLVWRLDRLSRSLSDLILLADKFGELGVALHSVSENLDLSSASGRMFYNILGTFAQFFREQLAENVKMGNERAVKEGRWINRPKTGYDLIDGELVPNVDAARVQEIFTLRGQGRSYRRIEEQTAVRFSTVKSILESRIYLGEVLHNGEWFAGHHEAIITAAEFHAAHRGFGKGVRRSKDVLSGRVRCGLCSRRMAVNQNGKGSLFYKCRHRGEGCDQPARSTRGLSRAAVLGLSLLGSDERLQAAIRKELARSTHAPLVQPRKRAGHNPVAELATLSEARRKLLDLYYASKISADGFQEEERRLCAAIEAAREQAAASHLEERMTSDLELRFDEVARILTDLDIDAVWKSANEQERRVLIEELLEWVTVFPDHLEVKVTATPPLNVLFSEVGLMGSDFVGVGGGTLTPQSGRFPLCPT